MEYAYSIEVQRGDDPEPLRLPQIWLEYRLTPEQVFEHEHYVLRVIEVVKEARGGDPVPGNLGLVKVLVLRDLWEEHQQAEAARQEARRRGWLLVVDLDGYWQAWGAPRVEGQPSIGSDLATGATEAEAAERGLAVILERTARETS
jgi:hypothetical protein